jgi:hypothetical protein
MPQIRVNSACIPNNALHSVDRKSNATMTYLSVAACTICRSILIHFLLPGGVGHAGLRHFFFDAGEDFFVEFFLNLLLISHVNMMPSRPQQDSSI